jgi:putative SOS response-associated peptidase YedK
MRTINADTHQLMNQFHKPTDEKRMVVVLPEAAYEAWLTATAEHSEQFLVPFAAEGLRVGSGRD